MLRSNDQTPSRRRFEKMLGALRDRISRLEYPPGMQIGEVELAQEFGVSRTPVRRVLGRLEAEGLVERRHGVGTIVANADFETLGEVYALRVALSPLIGRLAPFDLTAERLEAMKEALESCDRLAAAPDLAEFTRVETQFSTTLYGMIGNAPLREIVLRLYLQTSRLWISRIPEMSLPFEIEIFRRQVADMIAALEIPDHAAVGDLAAAHVSMVHARMRGRPW